VRCEQELRPSQTVPTATRADLFRRHSKSDSGAVLKFPRDRPLSSATDECRYIHFDKKLVMASGFLFVMT
jgi:hypothetical protein